MNTKPKILDCTLRDGGYYNNWDFDVSFVNKYLVAISEAKIEYVEIGFRRVGMKVYAGECAFSTEAFLKKLEIPKSLKLGVMINAKEFFGDTEELLNQNFLPAASSLIDFVRVAINFNDFMGAKKIIEILSKKGYRIGFNLMQSHGRSEQEYLDTSLEINSWGNVDMLYFADSFGNMYPEDISKIVTSLAQGWSGELGFHSHNNKNLALINSIESLESGASWCDGTILGMGRGAGNVSTETLILEVNKKFQTSYELAGLIEIIQDFQGLKEKYKWGSSLYYHLAAEKNIHPTYVQELLDDDRFKNALIPSYLDNIPQEFISSFNSAAKEHLLNPYNKELLPSSKKIQPMAQDVVLLGSGPMLGKYMQDIETFCIDNKLLAFKLNIDKKLIDKSFISGFILANYTRILFQMSQIHRTSKQLVLPEYLVSNNFPSINLENAINFDLVLGDHFHVQDNGCVLKKDLTFAYAIAYLIANNVKRVFLAGFDGYDDLSRNEEVNQLLGEIGSSNHSIELIAITPTKYNLASKSIYDPSILNADS